MKPTRRLHRRLPGPVLLATLLLACRGEPADSQTLADRLPRRDTLVQAASTRLDADRRTAIVQAVERMRPSVVSISVQSRRRIGPQSMFDLFFVPQGRAQRVQGFGTGFIVRDDGVVITNHHVVAGADSIVVTLSDGTEATARLVGEDPATDIAVLQLAGGPYPAASLGRSDDLLTGEWVVALGNPYSYLLGNSEPTVTAGVVSATGRNILPSSEQSTLYLDMIQTDAAINPGNSGGPLVNALGRVVGVNSSIFSNTGSSVGIGFAIPIERALRVADELLAHGSVRRAWTGLEVAGADAIADWKRQGGVLVREVAPGGPGGRAGLAPGAVLLEANGRRLRNYLDWEAVKLDLHVGDTVRLRTREAGREAVRVLVSGDLPTVTAERVRLRQDIELVTVTPAIRAERGLRTDRGALIVRLSDDMAGQTGLRAGDVVIAIDRSPIAQAEEVRDYLDTLRPPAGFRVYVERGGRYTYTDLVLR